MESLTPVSALATNDGGILEEEVALLAAADAPLTAAAAAVAMTEWEAAGAVIAIQHAADLVQLAHISNTTENCMNHPAVAAAVLTRAVLSSSQAAISINGTSPESILRQYRVPLYNGDLTASLEYLDHLQAALEDAPQNWTVSSAPGFVAADVDTGEANNEKTDATFSYWAPIADMPYERYCFYYNPTLEKNATCGITKRIIPSFKFAAQCCRKIRPILAERQAYLSSPAETKKLFCNCFTEWDHYPDNIAYCLVNQALEQFMVREASDCLDHNILPDEWEERYAPQHCPFPSFCAPDNEPSKIRLLQHRDHYIQSLITLALASQHSIQIATCYLFATDPAARYIILDLLPYCARTNGVEIEILVDSLTIESAVIRSAFYDADVRTVLTQPTAHDTIGWSFTDLLPDGAPKPLHAKQSFESPLHFVQALDRVVTANPTYNVRWWCARDANMQYRIKNHCKCFIADREVAIVGGSNLIPTVNAAQAELDLLLAGPVVDQVSASFASMWHAMDPIDRPFVVVAESTDHATPPVDISNPSVKASERNRILTQLGENFWDDNAAHVTLVRSFPSSAGEDAIYRMVMGALQFAQKRIIVSMGHSNYPKSFSKVLAAATKRGVQVQVLANSKYSCDLLVNQRDLMLSARELLRIAPNVELYFTHWKRGDPRTPFAHAKYVTMDGMWNAIGSWNVWTRGSFYEMEHEAMIESTAIASLLEQKFETDKATTIRIFNPEELEPGGHWCPSGCSVCRCFGPFFQT